MVAVGKDQLLEQLYAEGVRCFEKGKLKRALRTFNEYLMLNQQSSIVDSKSPPYGLENASSYGDFEKAFARLLDERLRTWTTNREPYPRFLLNIDTEKQQLRGLGEKKMLFIIPQYIMNSSKAIECDFQDHFMETARTAGLRVDIFFADGCSYPDFNFDSGSSKADLGLLSLKISKTLPDLIFVDCNYLPSCDSLNPEFLGKLKLQHRFKVIGYLGDAWGSHWAPMANVWSKVCDLIFHIAPESPLYREVEKPNTLYWSACPVNERSFFPDIDKDLDISFIGSYVSGLRPFWLTVALQTAKRLKLRHKLLAHNREANVGLSMSEYAAVLRGSKMVLNFSTRVGPLKAMTGRTWQALNAAVLLLEEENPYSSAYFVPYVHFIPFTSRNELVYSIKFFSHHTDRADQIARSAQRFCREHYGSEAIWSRLIAAVYALV